MKPSKLVMGLEMTNEIQLTDVYKEVRKIVAEVFNTDESKLSMETKIVDDLGAESLDIISLLMEFEDKFDRKIPDEDVEKLVTIGNTVDYIMEIIKSPSKEVV